MSLSRSQNQAAEQTNDHDLGPSTSKCKWVKVIGAMPTEWVPLRRPVNITDIIRATDPSKSHDRHSYQRCFCQLRITSGCIPARLAQENIGILNQVDRVVLERSVRASGGAKPKDTGSEKHPQHGEHCIKQNKVQQHAGCATILIKEGDSLRLATPLF